MFRDLNFINVVVGTAYFDDSGNLITGSVDYDTYGDDALQLYVCTSRSPDNKVHIRITVSAIHRRPTEQKSSTGRLS